MALHYVVPAGLNLRSEPALRPGNRMAVLPRGHTVERIDDVGAGWWRVGTRVDGLDLEGHVWAAHLAPRAPALATTSQLAVDLPASPQARRDRAGHWAFPLGEPEAPRHTPPTRADDLLEILAWLAVEESARYRPGRNTYCNIYAYDVCHLAGVYLPRVFWNDTALPRVLAGESLPVVPERTVHELSANALHRWLAGHGAALGWARTTLDRAQAAANQGAVAVLSARHTDANQSGHIAVLVPEGDGRSAVRDRNGEVLRPVLSEAGRVNRQWQVPATAWWTQARFRAWSVWVHPGTFA
ncbi:MAG: SH3 domain-containing protein [Xanthomonadales bacterium]|nr:SH3 domain-containing protein [Xanthomonadales bacterium]